MSDYQVTNYGMCGECRWHKGVIRRTHDSDYYYETVDYYCDNKDSDYYTDYSEYTDGCEEWSERGIE